MSIWWAFDNEHSILCSHLVFLRGDLKLIGYWHNIIEQGIISALRCLMEYRDIILCLVNSFFTKMSSSEELGTLIQGSPCSPLSCHNCILWQVLPAVRTDHWPDGVNLSLHRWEVHLNQHFPNGGFLPAVLQSEPLISPGIKNQLLYGYMAIHHLPFCDI